MYICIYIYILHWIVHETIVYSEISLKSTFFLPNRTLVIHALSAVARDVAQKKHGKGVDSICQKMTCCGHLAENGGCYYPLIVVYYPVIRVINPVANNWVNPIKPYLWPCYHNNKTQVITHLSGFTTLHHITPSSSISGVGIDVPTIGDLFRTSPEKIPVGIEISPIVSNGFSSFSPLIHWRDSHTFPLMEFWQLDWKQ